MGIPRLTWDLLCWVHVLIIPIPHLVRPDMSTEFGISNIAKSVSSDSMSPITRIRHPEKRACSNLAGIPCVYDVPLNPSDILSSIGPAYY